MIINRHPDRGASFRESEWLMHPVPVALEVGGSTRFCKVGTNNISICIVKIDRHARGMLVDMIDQRP